MAKGKRDDCRATNTNVIEIGIPPRLALQANLEAISPERSHLSLSFEL